MIVEGRLGRERGRSGDAGSRGTARSWAIAAQAGAFTFAAAEADADAFLVRAALVEPVARAALVRLLAAGPALALAVEVWSVGDGDGQRLAMSSSCLPSALTP